MLKFVPDLGGCRESGDKTTIWGITALDLVALAFFLIV